jgi:hypothetical protein
MQIGFNLPLSGALTSADAFTRLAVEGEAIGFDYIALSDSSSHSISKRGIRIPRPASSPRDRAASATSS